MKLHGRLAARRLEKLVHDREVLAAETVRGREAEDLLGRRRHEDGYAQIARRADREPEVLGHEVRHEAGRVVAVRRRLGDHAGHRVHVLHDPGVAGDFEITSVRVFGSTPNPSAILNASLTATAATPAIRLLQIFATSPLPVGPTWMMLAPRHARTGRASSTSRASPPTMIASVASSARGTPPETGASMKRTPRFVAASATRRDAAGSIVDMSTQSRPLPIPSRIPAAPR